MTTIRLIISSNGQTLLETRGFTGESCRQASKFLEQALGNTTHEQLTSEFYQSAQAKQHVDERQ